MLEKEKSLSGFYRPERLGKCGIPKQRNSETDRGYYVVLFMRKIRSSAAAPMNTASITPNHIPMRDSPVAGASDDCMGEDSATDSEADTGEIVMENPFVVLLV